MMEWQPIETLPSHILGYEVLLFAGRSCFLGLRNVYGEVVSTNIRDPSGMPAKIGATHWMPLPSPPVAEETK